MLFLTGAQKELGRGESKSVPCPDLSPLVVETLDAFRFIPVLKINYMHPFKLSLFL